MIAAVADTHAALWYLLKNPSLSAAARRFMDDVAADGHSIGLSPISLAEIVYLVEKNRLAASAYEDLKNALADPEYVIEEAPFNGEIVEAMLKVSRADVPDMPDRIVAATGTGYLRLHKARTLCGPAAPPAFQTAGYRPDGAPCPRPHGAVSVTPNEKRDSP